MFKPNSNPDRNIPKVHDGFGGKPFGSIKPWQDSMKNESSSGNGQTRKGRPVIDYEDDNSPWFDVENMNSVDPNKQNKQKKRKNQNRDRNRVGHSSNRESNEHTTPYGYNQPPSYRNPPSDVSPSNGVSSSYGHPPSNRASNRTPPNVSNGLSDRHSMSRERRTYGDYNRAAANERDYNYRNEAGFTTRGDGYHDELGRLDRERPSRYMHEEARRQSPLGQFSSSSYGHRDVNYPRSERDRDSTRRPAGSYSSYEEESLTNERNVLRRRVADAREEMRRCEYQLQRARELFEECEADLRHFDADSNDRDESTRRRMNNFESIRRDRNQEINSLEDYPIGFETRRMPERESYRERHQRREREAARSNLERLGLSCVVAEPQSAIVVEEADRVADSEVRSDAEPEAVSDEEADAEPEQGAGRGGGEVSITNRLIRLTTADNAPTSENAEPTPVGNVSNLSFEAIACEKLQPAKITQQNKLSLLTNMWEMKVGRKIVYRYDVNMTYIIADATRTRVTLTGGPKNDSSSTVRQHICLAALRAGLEAYSAFRRQAATVYDGAMLLYTSEEMAIEHKELVLHVSLAQLPERVRRLISRVDVSSIEVVISVNTTAPQFDIGDFSNELNRDMAHIDRTRKNFLDLLTSQDAQEKGLTVFGTGRLFDMSGPSKLLGNGQERRHGVDKGIKFITGGADGRGGDKKKDDNVVAALLLDSKVGNFFTSQTLDRTLSMYVGGERNMDLNWGKIQNESKTRITDVRWNSLNKYCKGLRFFTTYSQKRTYTINGISDKPIGELYFTDSIDGRKVKILDHLERTGCRAVCNPNYPAIEVRLRDKATQSVKVLYFALEASVMSPNQRVPISKQDQPPHPVKPQDRWDDIIHQLTALNLDHGGGRNTFLKMFGVTMASKPMVVTGIRREAPRVLYKNDHEMKIDVGRCNWSSKEAKVVLGGHASRVLVAHVARDANVTRSMVTVLQKACHTAGINIGRWDTKNLDELRVGKLRDGTMHQLIFELFQQEQKKKEHGLFIILVDTEKSKSHESLKLAERRYFIMSQQITAENAKDMFRRPMTAQNVIRKMNCKLGGINYRVDPEHYAKSKWIAHGNVLIISYDVAHPGRQPENEKVIDKPSVVGFAFNGGAHPEAFIGDFHYQLPRREQVEDSVLRARVKWMLAMYIKNRGKWPEHILVIRDGVSEGQYRMVMQEELGALKDGCAEFGNMKGKPDWCPPMALVIATKRNAKRLFKDLGNGRVANVQPLTAVDRAIVRPNVNEAVMVTSHALQGTAKPVCYQLLVNEMNFKDMDEFESMMVALTFHHQISDMPISLPEPVYQADEWAKRGNNMWNGYDCHFNFPILEGSNPKQVNFEEMTTRLAYWTTPLIDNRINA